MATWATVADRVGRLRGAIAVCVLLVSSTVPAAAVASPDWVESGGRAARYPAERYVTGYGQARGRDAEVRARQAAMAALAQAVHVRIEFELEDDRRSGAGRFDESVAALTRTTSQLELQDVRFEIHRDSRRVHALAIVEREKAGARRRALRDRALVRAEACVADAELTRESGRTELAERQLEHCRNVHGEAIRHDAVSSALSGGGAETDVGARLERVERTLAQAERENENAPAGSPAEAADRLAAELVEQGLSRPRRLDVSPLADSTTDLPSPFGQVMAVELERALAAAWGGDGRARRNPGGLERDPHRLERDPRRLELDGTHFETGDAVRVTVIVREFGTGTLVGSAGVSLPRDAVPDGVALRPANWQPALAKRERLQATPAPVALAPAASALRVELWTDRGRDRVHYTEGEAIRVFFRVSGPAWVRLVYVLSNGLTVPIEESLHVDADRAHTAIAYSGRLEVVAPFGVEMLHASAFERPPAPLATRRVTVAGEPYDVIDDGIDALVRARGVRLRRGDVVAEDVLTITTLASTVGELRPRNRR